MFDESAKEVLGESGQNENPTSQGSLSSILQKSLDKASLNYQNKMNILEGGKSPSILGSREKKDGEHYDCNTSIESQEQRYNSLMSSYSPISINKTLLAHPNDDFTHANYILNKNIEHEDGEPLRCVSQDNISAKRRRKGRKTKKIPRPVFKIVPYNIHALEKLISK